MLMPCNVATRWNSTFDMLDYALEHRKAVDTVTQWQDLGLHKYELADHEWEIVEQLQDVLKVRAIVYYIYLVKHANHMLLYKCCTNIDSQGCHIVLFLLDTKPCHCDTRNGPC